MLAYRLHGETPRIERAARRGHRDPARDRRLAALGHALEPPRRASASPCSRCAVFGFNAIGDTRRSIVHLGRPRYASARMNRAAIVRGIQLIVGITLATFAFLVYRGIESKQADLAAGLSHLRPGWLVLAAVARAPGGASAAGCACSCSAACSPASSRVRTAIVSEFVLMFCAGVTPGQAGAAPSQVAVLVHGGMRFVDVATAALLTAAVHDPLLPRRRRSCSSSSAPRATSSSPGGSEIDYLLGLSVLWLRRRARRARPLRRLSAAPQGR